MFTQYHFINSLPQIHYKSPVANRWLLAAALVCSACANDERTTDNAANEVDDEHPRDSNTTASSTPDAEPDTLDGAPAAFDGGARSTHALYGVGSLTFGEDNMSNAYLLLVSDIDRDGESFDLKQGREFAGQSDLATLDGAILVANGDTPSITRHIVTEDGALEAGETVSFASYGIASAAFWNNQFVATDKAYMVNGPTQLIVWNPSTMELAGTVELPKQEARDGLKVVAGLADRSSVVHNGKFYIPVYWTDDTYAERSDDSLIIVVDVETDEVVSTIAVDCPGMDYATVDDDGKLHFSNWTGGVGTYYVLGTAQNCIATVDPETEEVKTRTFASITGGHEGAAFKYAGNGRFVLSVFDEVKADINNAEDPFTPIGGLNWRLWSYDPQSETAAPIEAVDWNSGAIIHNWAGGSLYSMVPGADYKSTSVYKLLGGEDAEASFTITGWSFRLLDVAIEN